MAGFKVITEEKILGNRATFSKRTYFEDGRPWWGWHQVSLDRLQSKMLIAYPEIASHNHFYLSVGTNVFKQTAPVIMLRPGCTRDYYATVIALRNSSTACFWMKQVAHQKQMTGGDGVRVEFRSKVPYQFSGTQLGKLPVPSSFDKGPQRVRLTALAKEMDRATSELSILTAHKLLQTSNATLAADMLAAWGEILDQRRVLRARMVPFTLSQDMVQTRLADTGGVSETLRRKLRHVT